MHIQTTTSHELTKQEFTPQQRGWLNMATAKNSLVEELVKLSLACQEVLLKPAATITEKESQLADYRKAQKAITEARLSSEFVKRLNAVQDELMRYEKEADPKINEGYKAKESELFELKLREQRKAQEANEKNAEVARYKAHIQNQINLMISDFKQRAWSEIKAVYNQAIEMKDKTLLPELENTIGMMQFMQPSTFQRTRVTNDESKVIMSEFQMPKIEEVRTLMIDEARNIFLNLESDIAANTKPDIGAVIYEIEQEAKQEELLTDLAAQVSTLEVVPEGKGLKTAIEIEVEESQAWHTALLVAWLKYPEAAKHLRVKKWSALSLGQMAIALGKLATERELKSIPGLKLKEVTTL